MLPLSSVEVTIADGRLRPLFKLTFYDLDRLNISRAVIRAALVRRGIDLDDLFWTFRGMALHMDDPAPGRLWANRYAAHGDREGELRSDRGAA